MNWFRLLIILAAGVVVTPWARSEEVSFTNEVMAVLSRSGCNAGPCHGNLNGKGGFKLSLRGENPAGDWSTMTREMLGRRIDRQVPEESLLLRKAAGQVPHEGGVRFAADSREYELLKQWIARGAPYDEKTHSPVMELKVTPSSSILSPPDERVQLSARARFADGQERDVTGLVAYEMNNVGIARVQSNGIVLREQDGETVVLVRI